MKNKENVSYLIITPKFIVYFAYAIFLVSFIFPPDYYESLINEPDHVFFSFYSFFYVTICISSILFGEYVCKNLVVNRSVIISDEITRLRSAGRKLYLSKKNYITIPLVFSIIVNVILIYVFYKLNSSVLLYVFSGSIDFYQLKGDISTQGSGEALGYLFDSVGLWCFYRFLMWRDNFNKRDFRYLSIILIIFFISSFLKSMIKLARYEFIPLVIGGIVIYLRYKYETVSSSKVLKTGILSMCSLVFVFSIFAIFRSKNGIDDVVTTLLGYSVTAYNHMAAYLDGDLKIIDPGWGYFAFPFMNKMFFIGNYLSKTYFGWMDPDTVKDLSFYFNQNSGLSPFFNWITGWGYLFESIGYLSFLYLFICGIFLQKSWGSFLKGHDGGVLFYPWFFFCMFFFFGVNMFFEQRTLCVILAFVFIKIYRLFFTYK